MDRFSVLERIEEIAEKVVENHNLELVHTEFVGSGKQQTVRVFIDKENGITHDDCSAVSQDLEKSLDAENLIEKSYVLEVSSPGIERGLYKLEDFERFKGENAKVRTTHLINNQRNYKGKILGVKENNILLDDKTNGEVEIPFEAIKKANLRVDFEKELKQAKRKP